MHRQPRSVGTEEARWGVAGPPCGLAEPAWDGKQAGRTCEPRGGAEVRSWWPLRWGKDQNPRVPLPRHLFPQGPGSLAAAQDSKHLPREGSGARAPGGVGRASPRATPRAGQGRAGRGGGVAYLSGSRERTGSRCCFSETQKPGEGLLSRRGLLPRGLGPTSLSVSWKSLGYTSCGGHRPLGGTGWAGLGRLGAGLHPLCLL